MHFAFTTEQLAFRDSVREALRRTCTAADVRAAWRGERNPAAWARLAELGVLAVLVPEAHGGIGGSVLDLVLPLEEVGRAALPAPVAETAAIAVPLLVAARDSTWLPRIVDGEAIVAVGLAGTPYVAHADSAHLFLLERDGAIHAVAPRDARLRPLTSVDGARHLFAIEWTPESPILRDPTAITAAFDRAALATAAQLLGLAQHLLDVTCEYVKVRKQFGSAVGSFQAVKHQLADACIALEFARPMVWRAASSLTSVDVSTAKALASDAAQRAARTALQCHGAIGYSFEYDLHLWMKRVWALAQSYGDAAWHRARVAEQVLDG